MHTSMRAVFVNLSPFLLDYEERYFPWPYNKIKPTGERGSSVGLFRMLYKEIAFAMPCNPP